MANYPQELAQEAVCQSHTGHMTGLWFLPALPLRLNTNECIQHISPAIISTLELLIHYLINCALRNKLEQNCVPSCINTLRHH